MKIDDRGILGSVDFNADKCVYSLHDGKLNTNGELHEVEVSIVQSRIFPYKTLSIIGKMNSGTIINLQVDITEDMIEHMLKPEVFIYDKYNC